MVWKHCVALLAIIPPRKAIATALIYGLSLSVRFTSATGEEVEIPPMAVMSIVTRVGALAFHDGWSLRTGEPVALQLGPSITPRGCHADCERPAALTPDCGAP